MIVCINPLGPFLWAFFKRNESVRTPKAQGWIATCSRGHAADGYGLARMLLAALPM